MDQKFEDPKIQEQELDLKAKIRRKSNLGRIIKYFGFRLLALFITVVIAIYILILIANMGGAVDNIRMGQIRESVGMTMMAMSSEMAEWPLERRREFEQTLVEQEIERLGLDQPFIIRSFYYLWDAITLDLGRAERMTSDAGSRRVQLIILERLPPTLMLMMSYFLLMFFMALFFALFLSRRYGSKLDRLVVLLAPTSAAPGWFYGIFLILIFAVIFGWLPYGGMVEAPPPRETHLYALSVIRHLILPVVSLIMGAFFINVYNWRTFFLIYSSEDYVEMAKAKGLKDRAIERKYILRPTLPPIITSFALSMIVMWMGAVILEQIFNWPGLGRMLFEAIGLFDVPVIVGGNVIYAYLLAATVFVLDIIYAVLDPRVKIGLGSGGDK